MDDQALRTCICETGRELLENGLVARTWGNVSARADGEHYLVTPSGMDYGSIAPEDIALCDLATGKWTGPRRPSGERAVHALAYSMFEDVNFVIHTHQTYASALGLCGYKPGCFTGEERQQLGGVTVAGSFPARILPCSIWSIRSWNRSDWIPCLPRFATHIRWPVPRGRTHF